MLLHLTDELMLSHTYAHTEFRAIERQLAIANMFVRATAGLVRECCE